MLVRNRSESSVFYDRSNMTQPLSRSILFRYTLYKLSLCLGYTWRARWVNWYLSQNFFKTTRYLTFREIFCSNAPGEKIKMTLIFRWWMPFVSRTHTSLKCTSFNRSQKIIRLILQSALPKLSITPSCKRMFLPTRPTFAKDSRSTCCNTSACLRRN
jgi:hypothetical protein